jgi:hypothetical protein
MRKRRVMGMDRKRWWWWRRRRREEEEEGQVRRKDGVLVLIKWFCADLVVQWMD